MRLVSQVYSIWKYQQFPFTAYEKRRSETKKGGRKKIVDFLQAIEYLSYFFIIVVVHFLENGIYSNYIIFTF